MSASLVRWPLGLLLLAATIAGLVPQAAATSASAAPTARSPIRHVVVVYQENQTFDSMLGAVCQQRTTPCDGDTGPVTTADGTTIDNRVMPDLVPGLGHMVEQQEVALENRWDEVVGCSAAEDYACVTHADPSEIPNLTALAKDYAVSDATFASGGVASFTAHVGLATGTTAGFWGNNPIPSATGVAPNPGWGCPSHKDALWGVGFQDGLTYEPSCIPLRRGRGTYRPTQVPHVQSIMRQLENAGLTWRIYVGTKHRAPEAWVWNFCSYIAWCDKGRTDHVSHFGAFRRDAESGTLPNVSFVPATSKWSQHNLTSLTMGDNYLGSMVGAAMAGPEWPTTAIFITYDDCGCFYDHVSPPSGLGLRNPMVIVSPWAKPQSTDTHTAEQPYSMLSFIDNNFGLEALSSHVESAYDYSGSFDFTVPARTRSPAMVHTAVSPRIRALVRRFASQWVDDPT